MSAFISDLITETFRHGLSLPFSESVNSVHKQPPLRQSRTLQMYAERLSKGGRRLLS